ncbi:DUF736 domain-containing protein [Campylobacter fetus]|uniref:DUF736 family protein n=1 Tax=Campylobacter fetus TaxID=196 RepID=UPI0011CCB85F|nr:DUF736 family protein [Campylobacter fetus]EAJ1232602.1 DUF736 domain-containing protein [Campylobacter fetus]EAK0414719.1 DUF736 domain-containing protein [Campylobacter fetus]TXF09165.1 DUF736 domain-containing protein [Campylobacter fetus subsp. fetus]
MNIGYFKHEAYKNANGDEIGYTGGIINLPLCRPLQVALITPKADKTENSPSYQIALQKPKGYEGSRQIIGSLWAKQSESGKSYFSGYIESPLLPNYKTYIAMFVPIEQGSKLMYELIWNAPKQQKSDNFVPQASTSIEEDASNYTDDVIPF